MQRRKWLNLAGWAIKRILYSAHDMTKEQTLDEFLADLKTIMENIMKEVGT